MTIMNTIIEVSFYVLFFFVYCVALHAIYWLYKADCRPQSGGRQREWRILGEMRRGISVLPFVIFFFIYWVVLELFGKFTYAPQAGGPKQDKRTLSKLKRELKVIQEKIRQAPANKDIRGLLAAKRVISAKISNYYRPQSGFAVKMAKAVFEYYVTDHWTSRMHMWSIPRRMRLWRTFRTSAVEVTVDNLEKWVLLLMSIYDSGNIGRVAAIGQFIKTHVRDVSLTNELVDYAEGLLRIYEPESSGDVLKEVFMDFKKLKLSPFYHHLSNMLALIVSTGLCPMIGLDANVRGIKLFSEKMKEKWEQSDPLDLFTAVGDAIIYFIDVGHLCFSQQSIKPILFTDNEAYAMDQLYIRFIAIAPLAMDYSWDQACVTDAEFRKMADDLQNYNKTLLMVAKNWDKAAINGRLMAISKIMVDFNRVCVAGALRKAPYVLCVYGGTSVGKSTVVNLLNIPAILASGGEGDPTKSVVWNDSDEYFSNYHDGVESIIFDDMCNTRPEFVKTSPLSYLLQFANNMPMTAVMADLASKGKLAIKPFTIAITTNVGDVNASIFSQEPVSILRRINVRVYVTVKPEFAKTSDTVGGTLTSMLDSEKYLAAQRELPEKERDFVDAWNFTLARVVPRKSIDGRPDYGVWETIRHNGKILENIGLREAMDFVGSDAMAHSERQKIIVNAASSLHKRIQFCSECEKVGPTLHCDCLRGVKNQVESPRVTWCMDCKSTKCECFEQQNFVRRCTRAGHRLGGWIDEYICQLPFVPVLSWAFMPVLAMYNTYWAIAAASCLEGYAMIASYVNRYRAYYNTNDRVYRDAIRSGSVAFAGVTAFLILRQIIFMWRRKSLFEQQSWFNPSNHERVLRRAERNPWRREPFKPGAPGPVDAHISRKLGINSVFVESRHARGSEDKDGFTAGVYLSTHILLLPNHFADENMELIISNRNGASQDTYSTTLDTSYIYRVPESDLAICYVTGGTDKKNLSGCLPVKYLEGECPVKMQYWSPIHGERFAQVRATMSNDLESLAAFVKGGETVLPFNTFPGLCMAGYVKEGASPCIAGFHVGGRGNKALFNTLLLSEYQTAMKYFDGKRCLRLADSGVLDGAEYAAEGGTYLTDRPIKPSCSTQWLPETSAIVVLSALDDGHTFKSACEPSPITDDVLEICGMPAEYVRPIAYGHVPFQLAMSKFSTPARGPYQSVLRKAADDYLAPLLALDITLKPLDDPTIVNGKDGDRFINRMPQNTSVGFPLTGKLERYCTVGEPLPNHELNCELDPKIWKEYGVAIDKYKRGVCAYPVFRASLKDEPVKLEDGKPRKKIRVFQAAPVVLKMVLRKYFLPIAAELSTYPFMSECAVGINALSYEWNDMIEFITHNGDHRMIAGDYSAYDQRMSPALTTMAYTVLIELAEKWGYSLEDLTIMRSVVTDVVYPVIAYNGTLVKLYGSNPSGQNVTVYINSIVNSLISRCAFFQHYDFPYRNAVSCMTYGDDDIGSVHKDFGDYNCISKSEYITSIGMDYTPPAKDGEFPMFWNLCEIDFLKRNDVLPEEFPYRVGALNEKSIFKSLHVMRKSKGVSRKEWIASVIDGAVWELTPHGPNVFEERRQQLAQIASIHDVSHFCTFVHLEYSAMVKKICAPRPLVTDE